MTHTASIRVPLLVLQGDEDEVVPPAQARRWSTGCTPGAASSRRVYEGEGHGWTRKATIADELERTLGSPNVGSREVEV